MQDSLIIIPTYNEKENIASILRAILELPKPFDVLVIDDNSPDGTGDIVKDCNRYDQSIHQFLFSACCDSDSCLHANKYSL